LQRIAGFEVFARLAAFSWSDHPAWISAHAASISAGEGM